MLHTATEDAKDVDLAIRLADEAELATIVDDDEIERKLQVLAQDAEAEKLVARERVASGDTKRLEERPGEMNTPTDVPEASSEPGLAAPVEEGTATQKSRAFLERMARVSKSEIWRRWVHLKS